MCLVRTDQFTFTSKAGDGRIADVEITFKGGMASKISEKVVKVLEGESKEYQAVNTSPILSVSRQKVSVKSSDESIFTAEILTRAAVSSNRRISWIRSRSTV